MIELFIEVCMANNRTDCKTVREVFPAEEVTIMQCQVGAQSVIAAWLAAHPKYEVKEWGCRDTPGRFTKA